MSDEREDQFDLWTSSFARPIPYAAVDGFLRQHHPEGARIEYRAELSKRADGRVRTAETVGAMANTGGGLIFLGVEEAAGVPRRWPTLASGTLGRVQVEDQCRTLLRPYVDIETVVVADPTTGNEIVVVRVPSQTPAGPVYVEGRGVLIRAGEATRPATVEQIRSLLIGQGAQSTSALNSLSLAIRAVPNLEHPVFAMATAPLWSWPNARWTDETLDAVERLVSARFGDMQGSTAGDRLIDFQVEDARQDLLRHVWVRPDGTLYRRFMWTSEASDPIDILRVAGEVRRTWLAGQDAVRQVLVGYLGPIAYRVAIGSVKGGFVSHPKLLRSLTGHKATPVRGREGWIQDGEGAFDADPDEIVHRVVSALLLAFGYRHVSDVVEELVIGSRWVESAENPPW